MPGRHNPVEVYVSDEFFILRNGLRARGSGCFCLARSCRCGKAEEAKAADYHSPGGYHSSASIGRDIAPFLSYLIECAYDPQRNCRDKAAEKCEPLQILGRMENVRPPLHQPPKSGGRDCIVEPRLWTARHIQHPTRTPKRPSLPDRGGSGAALASACNARKDRPSEPGRPSFREEGSGEITPSSRSPQ